jgi:hypothetical protein
VNIQSLEVNPAVAQEALKAYKAHRDVYDKRDWEIERIYRAIAKGKVVIDALGAIRRAGLDEQGRPRLAIMRADQEFCFCETYRGDRIIFRNGHRSKAGEWYFEVSWPNRAVRPEYVDLAARLPRIPPQHRPAQGTLPAYHLLWEADWKSIPRDPYLLKRIGKDAWIVLAAWDLTPVELSVMRAHQGQ